MVAESFVQMETLEDKGQSSMKRIDLSAVNSLLKSQILQQEVDIWKSGDERTPPFLWA